ncbi:Carboxylesterase NP [Devosia sp. LC5]|uniref:DUF4180 domain-containing protein n=1 Tax=Devosia sp. LC5 TaxID=1502724 RepID=UPI0004E3781C|nr:DUF4180 domain-containing protein [Devosia sp. LC5]KFC67340.1 Carboxylesterase NP [Devosia sp. LC5]
MTSISTSNGRAFLELADKGPLLGTEADALDILSQTYGTEASVIVIPAARLLPDFLQLRTGMAGAFIQKLQNYGCRLVVLGDISAAVAASAALNAFVVETNRIGHHMFVPDRQALLERL